MSAREKETLVLLTKGYGASDIAQMLNVSPNYIYSMVKMLKIRFDVNTSNGIVVRAIAEGIVTPEGALRDESDPNDEDSSD
jgi:DNA-binding CsgD family transcriptional regulator